MALQAHQWQRAFHSAEAGGSRTSDGIANGQPERNAPMPAPSPAAILVALGSDALRPMAGRSDKQPRPPDRLSGRCCRASNKAAGAAGRNCKCFQFHVLVCHLPRSSCIAASGPQQECKAYSGVRVAGRHGRFLLFGLFMQEAGRFQFVLVELQLLRPVVSSSNRSETQGAGVSCCQKMLSQSTCDECLQAMPLLDGSATIAAVCSHVSTVLQGRTTTVSLLIWPGCAAAVTL